MALLLGADISRWQQNLTIKDLQKENYEFVILRGGYTGYGDTRSKNKDECFDSFYYQAKNLGMPVGVYFYSCATNEKEGIEEAEFLYEECLKDRKFEMPIYIDVENEQWQANKKKGVTDAIIGFCKTLEQKKFYSGVYASLNWFNNHIETDRLEAYTKWVAAWRDTKPPFKWGGFHMWQKSNRGYVKGTQIDVDVAFQVFPNIIKAAGLNGYGKSPGKQITYVVKKGDTLWEIAKKYLGDGNRYKEIKELNGLKSDLIYPGQKLKINV